jgi:ribosomal protein L37AE/L43A
MWEKYKCQKCGKQMVHTPRKRIHPYCSYKCSAEVQGQLYKKSKEWVKKVIELHHSRRLS